MLKTLLATTALATLLATGAIAQDATATTTPMATDATTPTGMTYTQVDTDNLATKVIGQTVYASSAADAEAIGNINDLVVSEFGRRKRRNHWCRRLSGHWREAGRRCLFGSPLEHGRRQLLPPGA